MCNMAVVAEFRRHMPAFLFSVDVCGFVKRCVYTAMCFEKEGGGEEG
jgi:hypothetical protein